jgi:hypothetical protein
MGDAIYKRLGTSVLSELNSKLISFHVKILCWTYRIVWGVSDTHYVLRFDSSTALEQLQGLSSDKGQCTILYSYLESIIVTFMYRIINFTV